jgi:hypothetical protein
VHRCRGCFAACSPFRAPAADTFLLTIDVARLFSCVGPGAGVGASHALCHRPAAPLSGAGRCGNNERCVSRASPEEAPNSNAIMILMDGFIDPSKLNRGQQQAERLIQLCKFAMTRSAYDRFFNRLDALAMQLPHGRLLRCCAAALLRCASGCARELSSPLNTGCSNV